MLVRRLYLGLCPNAQSMAAPQRSSPESSTARSTERVGGDTVTRSLSSRITPPQRSVGRPATWSMRSLVVGIGRGHSTTGTGSFRTAVKSAIRHTDSSMSKSSGLSLKGWRLTTCAETPSASTLIPPIWSQSHTPSTSSAARLVSRMPARRSARTVINSRPRTRSSTRRAIGTAVHVNGGMRASTCGNGERSE